MRQIARLAVVAVSVAWATGNARASITPSYEDDGKTMVLDVAEDDTLDIAIPSTVTNLVKTGDGKATLTQAPVWKLNLNPSGTALTFGAARGVVVIMR